MTATLTHENRQPAFDRVVLVHGYGADIDAHWFGFLAENVPGLERLEMPTPSSPKAQEWIAHVRGHLGDLRGSTAVVTHSLGGLATLRALTDLAECGGRLGALVMVAPFAHMLPTGTGDPELDRFLENELPAFLEGVDLDVVRQAVANVTVIRSDNDPIVPAEAGDHLASVLGAQRIVVPGAGHFLDREGVTRLEPVLTALAPSSSQ